MRERVRKLEDDMSFLRGKLDDMPTKDWITTRLAAVTFLLASTLFTMGFWAFSRLEATILSLTP